MVFNEAGNMDSHRSRARFSALTWSVLLLAWIPLIVIGGLSIQYSRTAWSGGQWAAAAANGAAICVAVIYTTSAILLVVTGIGLIVSRHRLWFAFALVTGLTPLVLMLWAFAERANVLADEAIIRPTQTLNHLNNLNVLGHTRLFGGSLWQDSTQADDTLLFSSNKEGDNAAAAAEARDFIAYIRSTTQPLKSSVDSEIYVQADPLLPWLTSDIASWIHIGSPGSDSLGSDSPGSDSQGSKSPGTTRLGERQWKACASSVLDTQLPLNADPPQLLLQGWVEYWSRDSDAIMDRYFQTLQDRTNVATLKDLSDKQLYNKISQDHLVVGAAFAVYLFEHLKNDQFLQLCNVANPETFSVAAEDILGLAWSETCDAFDVWTRQEADRLGWDRQETFKNLTLQSGPAIDDRIDQTIGQVNQIQIAETIDKSKWNELLGIAKKLFRQRLRQSIEGGFEQLTQAEQLPRMTRPPTKRLRILIQGEDVWFAKADDRREETIVVAADHAFVSNRSLAEPQRAACKINSDLERRQSKSRVMDAMHAWLLNTDFLYELAELVRSGSDWKLVGLTHAGEDQVWQLELRGRREDSNLDIIFQVDPNSNYRVSAIQNNKLDSVERKFQQFRQDFVLLSEQHSKGKINGGRNLRSASIDCQILTPQKAGSFREELAYMKVNDCQSLGTVVPSWLGWVRFGGTSFFILAGLLSISMLLRTYLR